MPRTPRSSGEPTRTEKQQIARRRPADADELARQDLQRERIGRRRKLTRTAEAGTAEHRGRAQKPRGKHGTKRNRR